MRAQVRVPDGLATLALAKTRCAPYSLSHRAASSRRPRAVPKPRARRAGAGAPASSAAGRRPLHRGDLDRLRSASSRGPAGPVGVYRALPPALFGMAATPPRRTISDRLLRVAGQFAHLRPKPICNGERCFGRGSAHPETLSRLAARRLVPRTPRARSRSAPADADSYGSSRATAGGKDPAGS